MNASLSPGATTHAPASRPRAVLAWFGDAALNPLRIAWQLVGVATAGFTQGWRPAAWRRTVRAELVRHCMEMGVSALPSTLLLGGLFGLGLVLQALYWLGLFGQSDVVGQLLVLILVRELGPLAIAMLLIGRSATVTISELHQIASSGRLATLEAMGIDPLHYLLLPRICAMALSSTCLCIVFIATALLVGHVGASVAGLTALPLGQFLGDVVDSMGLTEFALVVVKPLSLGAVIALMVCTRTLDPETVRRGLRRALPNGVVSAMVAALLVSGLISAVL